MSQTITFTVPGLPVAQPRQRHALVKGHLMNYTPETHPVNAFKTAVALLARQAYNAPLHDGPVEIAVDCYFPRPKRLLTKRSPTDAIPCAVKPDWDNIGKSVSDALKGVIWTDDARVHRAAVAKWYCAIGQAPETRIAITLREVQ